MVFNFKNNCYNLYLIDEEFDFTNLEYQTNFSWDRNLENESEFEVHYMKSMKLIMQIFFVCFFAWRENKTWRMKFNIPCFCHLFWIFQRIEPWILKWHLRFELLLLNKWLHKWVVFIKRIWRTRRKVGCNTRLNQLNVNRTHNR